MKVFILIVIGMVHGQPQAAPVGTYQTEAECQSQFQLLGMAAYVNHKQIAGACLSYELPGKDS
ncbi:MAG: hypothetical protein EOR11_20005 [Mesorhizobium sp.]|uniref:hypothetical protein n=1 Tax=Mesorhizobium sp. TaxID=1871066 RepID=UPI000FE7B346|nr:hypothetical protein [Mesorhizobium sp.]RWP84746.1 MAG: hypothetical protein EOR11_20005 [Mesorhizobium sp.]